MVGNTKRVIGKTTAKWGSEVHFLKLTQKMIPGARSMIYDPIENACLTFLKKMYLRKGR